MTRCSTCGRFWGPASGGYVYYPPRPAIPGVPDSGPHDEVYVCGRFIKAKEEIEDA